ncbi:MAG TPA: hypothetical protein VHJ82_07750 [Actinomycetota bacterium]|nr:hypothetical protein [Actinomycetota bacterium]
MSWKSRRHTLLVPAIAAVLVAASLGSPAVAQKKQTPRCGAWKTDWDYTPQLMKIKFTFDVRACELVPPRFQGPYLSLQPDFVLVGTLLQDDTLSASAIGQSATCNQEQLRCKITMRFEHFPIERANYSATAVLTSLKSPFVSVGAFYARCTSVYMTFVCGI